MYEEVTVLENISVRTDNVLYCFTLDDNESKGLNPVVDLKRRKAADNGGCRGKIK